MPEHLRALVVILVLAGGVFLLARRPALEIIEPATFSRRRNLWFALTLVAFLAHNYWIYAVIASMILLAVSQRDQNRLAIFFAVLFAVPPVAAHIPGLGLVNYLFALNHVRLLSLMVLLPAFLVLRQRDGTVAFGRLWPDRLLIAYLFVTVILQLRETTATDTLRQALHVFLDVFLPYYVASRALRDKAGFEDALLAFFLSAGVLAAVGMFEALRHWLLYYAVIPAFGLDWPYSSSYLARAGTLRASASTGHAIALGYVIVVALGCFLFLKDRISSKLHRWLGGGLLAGGLIAPLSRGPWVGAGVMLVTYLATSPYAARRFATALLAVVAAVPLLAIVPGGQKALDFLPFIGSIEAENISYRRALIDNALVVIERNPWLGSVQFLQAPEMEQMRQGQGIIDIVNTYVAITLEYGLVGLGLFVGFFLLVITGVLKAMRACADRRDEVYRLGQALLASLAAILVIIFTVSSITVIPIVYWAFAGLGVAYAQMIRQRHGETLE
jgi:O-antigen ligase